MLSLLLQNANLSHYHLCKEAVIDCREISVLLLRKRKKKLRVWHSIWYALLWFYIVISIHIAAAVQLEPAHTTQPYRNTACATGRKWSCITMQCDFHPDYTALNKVGVAPGPVVPKAGPRESNFKCHWPVQTQGYAAQWFHSSLDCFVTLLTAWYS